MLRSSSSSKHVRFANAQPFPYKNESGLIDTTEVPDPLVVGNIQVTQSLTVGTPSMNANELINGDLTVSGTIHGNVVGSDMGPHFTATDSTLQYRVTGGTQVDLIHESTTSPTFNLLNSNDVTSFSNLNTGTITASTSNSSTAVSSQTNTSNANGAEGGFRGINDIGATLDSVMTSSTYTNRGTIRSSSSAFGIDVETQGFGKSIRLQTDGITRMDIGDLGATFSGFVTSDGLLTSNGSTQLNGPANVTGLLAAEGALTVTGATILNGNTTVNGATEMNGLANVTGLLSAEGALTVTGIATMNGLVDITAGGLTVGAGIVDVVVGDISVQAGSIGVLLGGITVTVGSIGVTAGGITAPLGTIQGANLVAESTGLGLNGTIRADGSEAATGFPSGGVATGALQIPEGGASIGGDLYVGNAGHFGTTLTASSTNNSTSPTSDASLVTYGGIAATKDIWGRNLYSSGQTTSESTANSVADTDTTASLVSMGGLSVAKEIFSNSLTTAGNIKSSSTTNSTSPSSIGSITTLGGVSVAQDLWVGGTIHGTVAGSTSQPQITLTNTTGANVIVDSINDSSSSTDASASISTLGGLSVKKAINAGSVNAVDFFATLSISTSSTLNASSPTDTSASISTAGGLAVAKKIYATDIESNSSTALMNIVSNTGASSAALFVNNTSDGSFGWTGLDGTGISGTNNLYIIRSGGTANVPIYIQPQNFTAAQFYSSGIGCRFFNGASVTGSLSSTGLISTSSTNNSTGPADSTASIYTPGGVSITQDLWVGGTIHGTVAGSSTLGQITLTNTAGNDVAVMSVTDSSSKTDAGASIYTLGGLSVAKTVNATNLNGIIGGTSPTTGTFTTIGVSQLLTLPSSGVGIAVSSTNDSAAKNDPSASITTLGGLSVAQTINANAITSSQFIFKRFGTDPSFYYSFNGNATDVYWEIVNAAGSGPGKLFISGPAGGAITSMTVTGPINSYGAVNATQFQSTTPTGSPPLVVASTTNVPNLNASTLNGNTFVRNFKTAQSRNYWRSLTKQCNIYKRQCPTTFKC